MAQLSAQNWQALCSWNNLHSACVHYQQEGGEEDERSGAFLAVHCGAIHQWRLQGGGTKMGKRFLNIWYWNSEPYSDWGGDKFLRNTAYIFYGWPQILCADSSRSGGGMFAACKLNGRTVDVPFLSLSAIVCKNRPLLRSKFIATTGPIKQSNLI